MTLQPYPPAKLDDLAWRFFDLAADLRRMAKECDSHGISSLDLHDKKPQEWLAKLQDWTDRARAELEVRLVRQRAAQAAQRVADGQAALRQRRDAGPKIAANKKSKN